MDAARAVARAATWAVKLVRVCELVAGFGRRLLACPFVKLDLEGEPQVRFVSAGVHPAWMVVLPPAVAAQRRRCLPRKIAPP